MVSSAKTASNLFEGSRIEATTIRKLRIRLLPFLLALYVVAFIDRINLGFAALTMNRELAITSQQFGFAAGIFFWGYFLFEIPSNLMLHKIGARVWIARILITWGAVATLTGFVQSANQLYVARFALGLAEAGYFPGIVLYLGYWFRQREKAQAIALILMGIPLASVLGAPISGFILDHAHGFGLSSWRWLFILEGSPAVACVLLTSFLLPNRPAEARFLTSEEKTWIADQLQQEDRQKLGARSTSVARTSASSQSLAPGMYRFWPRLCYLHLQLLAAADHEVGLRRPVQYCGWTDGDDPQFPWPDRDDLGVSPLRPHAGAAIPHGDGSHLIWNRHVVAWSAALAISFRRSVFSRGHWGVQLSAGFLFDARRIPDRLLGGCGDCARDIRCELRRIRRALHRGRHSPKDGELLLRPDLRGSFLPSLSKLGVVLAQATHACS